jgi:hypothetical protein
VPVHCLHTLCQACRQQNSCHNLCSSKTRDFFGKKGAPWRCSGLVRSSCSALRAAGPGSVCAPRSMWCEEQQQTDELRNGIGWSLTGVAVVFTACADVLFSLCWCGLGCHAVEHNNYCYLLLLCSPVCQHSTLFST